jgi:RNA polymerase sigma-70 factor (ECF subfamily)
MDQEGFADAMTDAQQPLYVFICSLLGGAAEADDVLQEVNLVLWRKMREYHAGSFLAWAYRIARFQVMAHLKKRARDRRVLHDDVLDRIAARAERRGVGSEDLMEMLGHGLERLSARQREYLELRYRHGLTIAEIADRLSTTQETVLVMLCRARSALQRHLRTMLATP